MAWPRQAWSACACCSFTLVELSRMPGLAWRSLGQLRLRRRSRRGRARRLLSARRQATVDPPHAEEEEYHRHDELERAGVIFGVARVQSHKVLEKQDGCKDHVGQAEDHLRPGAGLPARPALRTVRRRRGLLAGA